MDYTDIHGTQILFGFKASDAPTGITGFLPRSVATSSASPEIFETATNGEGHVEAIAISKTANKKIELSFTGYITSAFNKLAIATNFTFLGRRFFITSVSDPRQKGQFVEVTIDAVSYPLVAS